MFVNSKNLSPDIIIKDIIRSYLLFGAFILYNGHPLFQNLNSDQLQAKLYHWLDKPLSSNIFQLRWVLLKAFRC